MILGLGVDTVTISSVERFLQNPSYASDIFTDSEQKQAEEYGDVIDFFAGRFAAKQAFKKCLMPIMKGLSFDHRMIEILRNSDGSPAVYVDSEELTALLKEAGVEELLVSITTEGDSATAIAIAQ